MTDLAASDDALVLNRDCPATTVPQGEPTTLAAGATVTVMQRLGGSISVRTEYGNLVRIDADDADALGLESPAERRVSIASNAPFHIDQVLEALGTVYDPEIPISIVDLGLVYRCEEATTDGGGRKIVIDMTMTSPGCGMGDIICDDATRAVARMPAVDEVEVNLVFDPPWGLDRINEEARLELGLF